MIQPSRLLQRVPLLAAVLAMSCATLPPALAAGTPISPDSWTGLAPGIEYCTFAWGAPRREVHALRIDLSSVDVIATPPGKAWGQVEARSLLDFLRDFGCVAAVNATPFYPDSFRRGDSLYLSGLLLRDGKTYSAAAKRYVALAFDRDGSARVIQQAALGDPNSISLAVGGFFELIRGGKIVARKSSREPMTVAGVAEGGRSLLVAIIEGRHPASAGASEAEAAQLLLDLGAVDGMSFDGGGSTSMAIVGPDGQPRLVNSAAAGLPPLERMLATCLGFAPKRN